MDEDKNLPGPSGYQKATQKRVFTGNNGNFKNKKRTGNVRTNNDRWDNKQLNEPTSLSGQNDQRHGPLKNTNPGHDQRHGPRQNTNHTQNDQRHCLRQNMNPGQNDQRHGPRQNTNPGQNGQRHGPRQNTNPGQNGQRHGPRQNTNPGQNGQRHGPRQNTNPGQNGQRHGPRQNTNPRQNDQRHGPRQNTNHRQNDQRHGPRRNEGLCQDHNKKIFYFGFKFLEQLTAMSSEEVIKKLEEKKDGLLNLLQKPMEKLDIFVLIISIMVKLTQTSFDKMASKILIEICNSNFLGNLRNYLTDLSDQTVKNLNKLYWDDPNHFWINFLSLLEYVVDFLPTLALVKFKPMIETTIIYSLDRLKTTHGFNLTEECNLKFENIREKLASYEETQKLETKKPHPDEEIEPPEDFRLLSILPTTEDFLDKSPFLRKNIIDGSYRDIEHYLDVQFRLLREDCYGPIRDGIYQYLADKNGRHFDDLRVYRSVKFDSTYVSKTSYKSGYIIQIDPKICKKFGTIRWTQNKRFLHGALLLLTKDNCRNYITAIILDRDIDLLKRGKIPVALYGNIDKSELFQNDSYTMFESEVYFEPYYHVLKALQNPSFPRHLAMSKYIVKIESEPQPPEYLDNQSEYSMMINDRKVKFKVLQEETWPRAIELGLNDSQYVAYKMALTHEFAVIQGPPGTGKTFLGVKVARAILKNYAALEEASIIAQLKSESGVDRPIPHSSLSDAQKKIPKRTHQACIMLLVCYTNHALDQFLEAILPMTDSIVRIGGQSRNETLTKYNINNLRRHSNLRGSLYNKLRFELGTLLNTIRSVQNSIELISKDVIIDYGVIKTFAPESIVLESLKGDAEHVTDPLIDWLFEGEHQTRVKYKEMVSHVNNYQIDDQDDVSDKQERRKQVILDDFEDEGGVIAADVKVVYSLAKETNELKSLIEKGAQCEDMEKLGEYNTAMRNIMRRIKISQKLFKTRERRTYIKLELANVKNIERINRWSIYFRWATIVQDQYKAMLKKEQTDLKKLTDAYEETRMIEDLSILKDRNVKVVGMTTSGAARCRKLLQELAPPIVIVEEAAEVLEAHIVTALTKNCQHLILIGDHQQLRPSASYIKLARQYNIEVSLFERMILNGMHSCRLDVQHRMRPEIAALISPHIYQHLENHPNVETFPDVRGVTKNVFFLSHNYIEEHADENSSRINQNEADLTLAFANYLMLQGYSSQDITILATYTGQMFYMKNQCKSYIRLNGVKITVVDNYQGEESKIILLSLVRNNKDGKIGFLGTKNRICVALSRAKEGFYMFGNIEILRKNELWNNIAVTLEGNESIGSHLTLRCENHRDQITLMSSVDDFKNVPEGGCLQKCNRTLTICGHLCTFVCHGYDPDHMEIKCTQKCERILCEYGHVCPDKCAVVCKPCQVVVKKILPCGHSANLRCHQDPETIKCKTVVTLTMPDCGHKIKQACHIPMEETRCTVKCDIRVERCGHTCTRLCHVLDDPYHENYICKKPCPKEKNGCSAGLEGDRGEHQCRRLCHEECEPCVTKVSKKRSICTHSYMVQCSEDVNLIKCLKNCTRALACGHFCKKKCHEACGDCLQKVKKIIPDCGHEVWMECSQMPLRAHCKENCERLMQCGHLCKGRCASPCNPASCETPLEESMISPCGHSVALPCYLSASFREGSRTLDKVVYRLSRLCPEPCGVNLLCEHVCTGTCGTCRQGRLHVPCSKPCGAVSVCGHSCESPCNQVCPPCNKQCPVKCPHNRCGNLCGAPCRPCEEICTRACEHSKCTQRCGEKCSRAACSERCSKQLQCGHPCRGLCGEPCPDVCAVCRPDSVPKDFILAPYEDDDIFIKLEDCPHIFSVEEMDMLVKSNEDMIKIPACPFCRVPIINTYRYKDIINAILINEINPVKKKVYGDETDIEQTKTMLRNKITTLENQQLPECLIATFEQLASNSNRDKRSALLRQETFLMKLNYIEILNDLLKKCNRQELNDVRAYVKPICEILQDETCKLSEQRQMDINIELKRIDALIKFAKLMNCPTYNAVKNDPKIIKATKKAKQYLYKFGVFDEEKCFDAVRKIQDSSEYYKMERELVVKAMGTKMGHWYKCPNGHPYYIGECGGANQMSKCIECGAAVGGTSHRLLQGNSHAGEVDGSSFAAWSEQANNMNNFDLNDL